MGRKKNSERWEVPPGVVDVVYGIVKDYERRSEALATEPLSEENKETYYKLNGAVDSALLMIEEPLRSIYINDLTNKFGYFRSDAMSIIDHKGYYSRKYKLIYSIAKILYLI